MDEHNGSHKIPRHWIQTTVDDAIHIIDYRGRTPPYSDNGVPHLRSSNVKNGKIIWEGSRYVSEDDYQRYMTRGLPEPGDLLFTTEAPLGEVALAPDCRFSLAQRMMILRAPKSFLQPKFLLYQIMTEAFQGFLTGKGTGTTVTGVSSRNFKTVPLFIAPFSEQLRIVAKIEELFTKLDAGVASLKAAKKQLKRYRQSVLKAAVEGELTREWREKHKEELEPASVLLERILKERRAKWEADQLAKMQSQGKPPKDNKWKANFASPAVPNTNGLPDLPTGWVWTMPETLSTFESNAICAGPFGTIFKAKDFRSSGIPIIFLRHVSPGRYLTRKPGFMDEDVWREFFQSYSVYGGELLVTKLGEPPGVCAIYPNRIGPAMVTPDVIKMSVHEKVAIPRFLMNYFNSEIARRYTFGIAFGTTRLRMTIPIFREMPIPLPPLAEQEQIVAEVERRLSVADEIEATLDAELKRAERLRQSILKRAFEGKLVPQDPNDEPASALLEKIKAEKAEQSETKKKSRVHGSKHEPIDSN